MLVCQSQRSIYEKKEWRYMSVFGFYLGESGQEAVDFMYSTPENVNDL